MNSMKCRFPNGFITDSTNQINTATISEIYNEMYRISKLDQDELNDNERLVLKSLLSKRINVKILIIE